MWLKEIKKYIGALVLSSENDIFCNAPVTLLNLNLCNALFRLYGGHGLWLSSVTMGNLLGSYIQTDNEKEKIYSIYTICNWCISLEKYHKDSFSAFCNLKNKQTIITIISRKLQLNSLEKSWMMGCSHLGPCTISWISVWLTKICGEEGRVWIDCKVGFSSGYTVLKPLLATSFCPIQTTDFLHRHTPFISNMGVGPAVRSHSQCPPLSQIKTLFVESGELRVVSSCVTTEVADRCWKYQDMMECSSLAWG